jgi:hypothetical protein
MPSVVRARTSLVTLTLSLAAGDVACGAARDPGPAVGTSLPPPATVASGTTSAEEASTDDTLEADASTGAQKAVVNEPDFSTIPWETGAAVGNGAAFKDTQNPRGENVFIAYSGWRITVPATQAWAEALYRTSLRDRGVRYVWAVRGPLDPNYKGVEIGNSKIATALVSRVGDATKFVLVVAHSSGSFVAHELFGMLANGGLDPKNVTAGRIVYFDLDGDASGLFPSTAARLRRGYFVGAVDPTTGTSSPNMGDMRDAAVQFGPPTSYWENDASASGCPKGDVWCLHVTCITQRPHPKPPDPNVDYNDFDGREVAHAFIDAKAAEAGLVP